MIQTYCLDSFAIIAYLNDESGAEYVCKILETAQHGKARIYMHVINLGEVYYTCYRKAGEMLADVAYGKVRNLPIHFSENLGEDFLLNVVRIKGQYHVSYADAFAIATAAAEHAVLLTGDPEISEPEKAGVVKVAWLR